MLEGSEKPIVAPFLVLSSAQNRGGAEVWWDRILASREDAFEFAVTHSGGDWVSHLARHGVPVTAFDLDAWAHWHRHARCRIGPLVRAIPQLLIGVRRLERWLRARRASARLLLTSCNKAHLLGAWLAPRLGLPVAHTIHDLLSADHFGWGIRRVLAAAFRRSGGACLAFSRAAAGAVADLGVPLSRITWFHHGVDVGRLSELAASGVGADRAGCRAMGCARVGLFGRVSPWKGQSVFLAAVDRLQRQGIAIVPVLVGAAQFGEGEVDRQCRAQADRLPRFPAVWTGWLENPYPWMRAVDVVVHASTRPEPFGLVVIEAMALGKPVIATAGGGVPEIVDDGRTGLLVPMNDAVAMAAAIRRLLADRDLAERLGRAAAAEVRRRFDLASHRQRFSAWLDVAAGGRV